MVTFKFIQYFQPHEFDSPDKPGTGYKMDYFFLKRLDRARGFAGIPFKINSGYRTKKHNKKVGGVEDSSHVKGLAVDIKIKTSEERYIIVKALIRAGFDRIGIGESFIHVDADESKQSPVIWVYD